VAVVSNRRTRSAVIDTPLVNAKGDATDAQQQLATTTTITHSQPDVNTNTAAIGNNNNMEQVFIESVGCVLILRTDVRVVFAGSEYN
jgi:hypothetical protein